MAAGVTQAISQKVGDAKIDRQGQTAMTSAGADYGSNPMSKASRRPAPTDLRP